MDTPPSPEQTSWLGNALTLAITLFGGGKAYGVLSSKTKANEDRLNKLSKDMQRVEDDSESRFKELLKEFRTTEGEPKFVTYRAHDKIQESCQGLIMNEFTHLKESIERIEKKIDSK